MVYTIEVREISENFEKKLSKNEKEEI